MIRTDPATNRVIGTAPAGAKPVAIAVVGRVAWVFCQADGTAQLWDARTARRLVTVSLGVQAGFVTTASGRLWVPDFQAGRRRWRPSIPRRGASSRGCTSERHRSACRSPPGPAGSATPVTRASPDSIRRRDELSRQSLSGGSIGPLLATPTAVWVSVYGGPHLADIDPTSTCVARTLAVGDQPQNLALVNGQLWLTEGGANALALVAT